MVPLDQVKRGLARYMESEILSKMTGWQKWVAGAAVTAYLMKADAVVQRLKAMPAIGMLEIIDDGYNIDIDMVYSCLRPQAEKGSAAVALPGLGQVTLSVADVDRLYQCIMQG